MNLAFCLVVRPRIGFPPAADVHRSAPRSPEHP